MMTIRELLHAVKTAQAIPSNYRLARFLDVPETTVQRWNTGRNLPDDLMGVRLAELAGLDPGAVVAAIHAQRAPEGAARDLWAQVAKRLQSAAVVGGAVFLSGFLGGGLDGTALAKSVSTPGEGPAVYYVNWRLLRALCAVAYRSIRRFSTFSSGAAFA